MSDPLADLEAALGHAFADRTLLGRALTHSSIARTAAESNERLEFLGDAVLGAAVCARLFERHPELPEGELTRLKSALVSRRHCATLAERLRLEPLIRTGKGLAGAQRATGRPGRVPRSVLSNAFEAVLGAAYLDGGFAAAAGIVNRLLDAAEPPAPLPHGERPAAGPRIDRANHKSRLQHAAQAAGHGPPRYELRETSGPDHAKRFTVRAIVGGTAYPSGEGVSKKEAEQRAAAAALALLTSDEFAADGGGEEE